MTGVPLLTALFPGALPPPPAQGTDPQEPSATPGRGVGVTGLRSPLQSWGGVLAQARDVPRKDSV